jgi:hypothetical protein
MCYKNVWKMPKSKTPQPKMGNMWLPQKQIAIVNLEDQNNILIKSGIN